MLIIRFDKDMTPEERQETLNTLKQWISQPTVSAAKRDILEKVIHYAENKLVKLRFYVEKERVLNCKNIFSQADLPDLLFIQHTSNLLSAIEDPKSELKNQVLPTVQAYKERFLSPSNEQIQNMGIGLALVGFFYLRDPSIIMGAIVLILFSKYIAEQRLNKKLNSVLNDQSLSGNVPRLEDGWDDLLINASAVSGRMCRAGAKYAIKLFERAFPALEEQKVPALPAPAARQLQYQSPAHLSVETLPPSYEAATTEFKRR